MAAWQARARRATIGAVVLFGVTGEGAEAAAETAWNVARRLPGAWYLSVTEAHPPGERRVPGTEERNEG